LERPDALRRAGERSRGLVSLAPKLNFSVPRIAQLYVCGIRNAIRRGNLLCHVARMTPSPKARTRNCSIGDEFAAQ